MMTKDSQGSREYCEALVRRRDEDRWLAAQYAAPHLRSQLLALAAFQCELRQVPAAVSEPPLGEIRLQWWRDALDELRDGKTPRAHPVVEALSRIDELRKGGLAELDEAIDATARTLYSAAFSDPEDLFHWLAKTDGGFDAAAYRLATASGDAPEAIAALGAGFACAREGARLAPALAAELPSFIRAATAKHRGALESAPDEAAPAILHLSLTGAYARRKSAPFPVIKRLRLFAAMAFGAW